MRWRWCALVVLAGTTAATSEVHGFPVLNARCETYSRVAVECVPPLEYHHVSPSTFVTFADSSFPSVLCLPYYDSSAQAITEQITRILADSIRIHEYSSNMRWGPQAQYAGARSDAVITFRVEASRQYTYTIQGTLWATNPSTNGIDGSASARYSFSRVDSTGLIVIHSLVAQAGPSPPTEVTLGFEPRGSLEPGDYVLEAHTSAENPNSEGINEAELWLRFWLRDVTTRVNPTTWGRLKALYRDATR